MEWTTVTLQVTTPLFNGGADPDGTAGLGPPGECGVRVASIRGAMRFWFRALAGSATGTDLRLLARAERAVFGGVTSQRDGEDAAVSSPLVLRLPDPPRQSSDASFLDGGRRAGLRYLLGLGLMRPRRGGADLLRPYVPPLRSFPLMIGFRHAKQTTDEVREAVESLAFASLWLMCSYGGLGARTRRGLGGLRITGVSGPLPASWQPDALATPGLDFYRSANWLRPLPPGVAGLSYGTHLPALIRKGAPGRGPLSDWAEPPPFPVIAKASAPAGMARRSFTGWEDALSYAGRQWRMFRANRPDDDQRVRDQGQVKTAEWDTAIKRDGTLFPLGALGLPVGFHQKNPERTYEVTAMVPAQPKPELLRRASPVWLRAIGSGRSWGLFSYAFHSQLLPEPAPGSPRVYRLPDHELKVTQQDVTALTGQWLDGLRRGDDFTARIRQ